MKKMLKHGLALCGPLVIISMFLVATGTDYRMVAAGLGGALGFISIVLAISGIIMGF